ncbi:MAG TPA: hypothetical protein VGC69_01790 [Bordetella sp.]
MIATRRAPRYARLLGCAALLALVLSGCTQYQWYKDRATQDDYNQDTYACDMESAHAYPAVPAIGIVSPGFMTPPRTYCRARGCYTSPGYYIPPDMGTVDLNEDNRSEAAKRCMYARGWQLIEVK